MNGNVCPIANPRKKGRKVGAVQISEGTYSVSVTTAVKLENPVLKKRHQRQSVTLDVGDT